MRKSILHSYMLAAAASKEEKDTVNEIIVTKFFERKLCKSCHHLNKGSNYSYCKFKKYARPNDKACSNYIHKKK